MELVKLLVKIVTQYKTYASTLVAVFSALALVFGGDYINGVPMLASAIQALLVLAAGGAVAGVSADALSAKKTAETAAGIVSSHFRLK